VPKGFIARVYYACRGSRGEGIGSIFAPNKQIVELKAKNPDSSGVNAPTPRGWSSLIAHDTPKPPGDNGDHRGA
jgi:hypothetical protein